MVSSFSNRSKVFISYSHKDTKYLNQLLEHLAYYERIGLVDAWSDYRITSGTEWRKEIKLAIASAKIAVLLISPSFLASQFIAEEELPPLLIAAQKEGIIILPIIVRPSNFEDTELSQFQAVNTLSAPLSKLKGYQRDEMWAKVAKDIKKIINNPQLSPHSDKKIQEIQSYSLQLEETQVPEISSSHSGSIQRHRKQLENKHNRIKDRSTRFDHIEPKDLNFVPVVVQALDNQWIPRSLLDEVMKEGRFTNDISIRLNQLVRSEYIRALINSRQIVINRAYLYNNSVLFQDYLPANPMRKSFIALLEEGIIVPLLMAESTPDEEPSFGMLTEGFQAWKQLCQDVHMSCLRFSWDQNINKELIHSQLSQRFHDFASTAVKNVKTYTKELNIDTSAEAGLRKCLNDIARICFDFIDQDKLITRNDLYKAFVTAGDNPAERLYDSTKPFAAEIKQIIDLAYNTYLAEGLSGYLLTPFDSLSSIALQEWQRTTSPPNLVIEESLGKMLRQSAFPLIQSGLYLKSMGLLSLQDVCELRTMEEWNKYIDSLDSLLENPIDFVKEAPIVCDNYTKLAVRMKNLVLSKNSKTDELIIPIAPVPEVILEVGGAALSITWTENGLVCQLIGEATPQTTPEGDATFVARFNISNKGGSSLQSDIFTSHEFMRGKLQDAQEQWKGMLARLKETLSFQEISTHLINTNIPF